MKRIGLFGGTFDPPHVGHLTICKTVLSSLSLDEVWLIPTYQPPHKQQPEASFEHRNNMLQYLISHEPQLKISTVESERRGRSYTIDTVKILKEREVNSQFFFIIGGDMVEYLPKWYAIDELKTMIQFVGVTRPGSDFVDQSVLKVNMEEIDVSSTVIREQIERHEHPEGLPIKVYDYIKEHGLYGS
ncbi:nicotinate-nucleotide adenylyltransferase [Alkalibacillus haloalkaliphilus]|uniref:Probable nicotinate-nucleotide adenylyltransferase n=1 Tax=Alkalibacillus haloalkaliphilus TaxID=94136 RepID=A0A511W5U9_9BACI|nr:nicotinate-nucleotide adenylyltransferase [Alkalibacillus haloalkaliphilus]GEN46474.1 nicotinate-nucleotide adenylyltransferase [Alkalibacillus haloalkaliphilus]